MTWPSPNRPLVLHRLSCGVFLFFLLGGRLVCKRPFVGQGVPSALFSPFSGPRLVYGYGPMLPFAGAVFFALHTGFLAPWVSDSEI